jgi:hypothetical protein
MKVFLTLDDYNTQHISKEVEASLEWLLYYFPKFKVNLLASYGLPIPENKHQDKFAYLLHGNEHEHYDELTDEQLQKWPYDKLYRAPFWELSDDFHKRLLDNGYKVLLDIGDKREGIIYNWDIMFPPDLNKSPLIGQGHITVNNYNYIVDKLHNVLLLPRDTDFGFIKDWGKE